MNDGARGESIELFLKEEGSRVSVTQKNKLEQLRKLSLTENLKGTKKATLKSPRKF